MVKITGDEFESVTQLAGQLGSYSLGGSGLSNLITTGGYSSSGPVWDSGAQAYYDQGASGLSRGSVAVGY